MMRLKLPPRWEEDIPSPCLDGSCLFVDSCKSYLGCNPESRFSHPKNEGYRKEIDTPGGVADQFLRWQQLQWRKLYGKKT
jgi:hypothetical protein